MVDVAHVTCAVRATGLITKVGNFRVDPDLYQGGLSIRREQIVSFNLMVVYVGA